MPVLSDGTIETLVDEGTLEIEPFDTSNLTPNGYDLRVGEVAFPDLDEDKIVEGTVEVPKRERFLLATDEVVTLGEATCAQLWIRSTYARKGVMAAFGKVEAGFSGQLTIGCFNAARDAVEIPIGSRFCQIAFEPLTASADAVYEERSGTYQNQRGVTTARD